MSSVKATPISTSPAVLQSLPGVGADPVGIREITAVVLPDTGRDMARLRLARDAVFVQCKSTAVPMPCRLQTSPGRAFMMLSNRHPQIPTAYIRPVTSRKLMHSNPRNPVHGF